MLSELLLEDLELIVNGVHLMTEAEIEELKIPMSIKRNLVRGRRLIDKGVKKWGTGELPVSKKDPGGPTGWKFASKAQHAKSHDSSFKDRTVKTQDVRKPILLPKGSPRGKLKYNLGYRKADPLSKDGGSKLYPSRAQKATVRPARDRVMNYRTD